jgi:mutator protein MutT
MEKMSETIEMNKIAVCALIKHPFQDLYLGVSRKHDPSLMGLPGGKVEPGETLEQAVCRELLEETGVRLYSVFKVFEDVDVEGWHTSTFMGAVISTIAFEHFSSVSEGEGVVAWITKEQLIAGPFGDYNVKLFKHLEVS